MIKVSIKFHTALTRKGKRKILVTTSNVGLDAYIQQSAI